jgi:hypothetical protein
MRRLFSESQHLVRAGALLVGMLFLFLVLRGLFVPDGFGELGHYRSGALADNAARPLGFAGREACAECHSEVVDVRRGGRHEGVGCESCHGALAAHAVDPGAVTPARPDAADLCLRCHRTNSSKPAAFPQIDPGEHGAGSACTECHRPHHPEAS